MRFRHRRFIAIALGAIALACGLEQRDLSPEAGSSSAPVRPAPNDGGATGVVTAKLDTRPPGSGKASITTTTAPASSNCSAAASPDSPAPMMMVS